MFFETSYDVGDGLGESKESIIARGCTKVSKGQFKCPDGSTVTPDSGYFTAAPGGDITRTVPDTTTTTSGGGKCPPGQYWVGPPISKCMADSGGGGGDKPSLDTGGVIGTPVSKSASEGAGFFSQEVMGIPVWMIAAGIGAVLLLKKR